MPRSCPEEAARPADPGDRTDIEALRDEARAVTVTKRGGAAFWERDRPAVSTDPVLASALAGAPDARAFVGTLDGLTVGYVFGRFAESATGRVAVLVELWVTPQARGVGVGEAMMDSLVTWARTAGCVAIDSMVLPGDRETKNFFETHRLVARAISVSRSLE